MYRLVGVAAIALGLAGCQTTGANVSPAEAGRYQSLVASSCVWVSSGGHMTAPERMRNVTITSIVNGTVDGRAGWQRIGFLEAGKAENLYVDTQQNRAYCGTSFSRAGYGRFQVVEASAAPSPSPSQPQPIATSVTRAAERTIRRPIAFDWQGVTGLVAGAVVLRSRGGAGDISAQLPGTSDSCSGQFAENSSGEGNWQVSCTNGRTARGVYRGLGAGRGAMGTGLDDLGRTVKFTMGSQE